MHSTLGGVERHKEKPSDLYVGTGKIGSMKPWIQCPCVGFGGQKYRGKHVQTEYGELLPTEAQGEMQMQLECLYNDTLII